MAENYVTTALKRIKQAMASGKFYIVVQGGASAGKTYAIMVLLISFAQSFKEKIITVVGEDYPHLKGGTIRDFQAIMKNAEIWEPENWNQSSLTYTFSNGSILEFKSIDKMGAHGPRRDVLFVNEANAMNFDTFDQLATRTRRMTIIDFNPTAEFWAHTEIINKHKDETEFLVLTYKQNEALSDRERQNILRHKPKQGEEPSNWWTVYGLGQIGSLEGNVYEGWIKTTPEATKNAKLVRYGLDFGFSNDETAMVAIWKNADGSFIAEEKLYRREMLGSDYAPIFRQIGIDPNVLIVADSARPEIIAEIKKAGFRIVGADKNPGSVLRGIDRVKQQQIYYIGSNLEKEYLAYAWRTKRSGEVLDEPQDGFDHCLPADTLVDTTAGQIRIGDLVGKSGWLFSEEGKIRKFRNVRKTGAERILKITLADGTTFRCSEEHPIYTKTRGVVPASLLNTEDVIQWVYDKDNQSGGHKREKATLQWREFLERAKERLLQKRKHAPTHSASNCLGVPQREDTGGAGHRPHRPEQGQQPDRKPSSGDAFNEQPERFGTDEAQAQGELRKGKGADESMARLRGGEKMALRTWQACISKEKANRKRMCSLWEKILYNTILRKGSILLTELQDERKKAQTKGTCRKYERRAIQGRLRNMWARILVNQERCADMLAKMSKQKNGKIANIEEDGTEPVFCLDVFDTSTFSIEGGVIVSNCLDSIRYAVDDLQRPRFDF